MKPDANAPSEGDQLLATLAALANPHRLRVIAALAGGGRTYVSQLARDIGISRPLLHLDANLSDLRTRMEAVETILKAVE
jgi:hypothetical protein